MKYSNEFPERIVRDSQIEFYPVNVPIIRRRDATAQDGLCKTPLVMLAPESSEPGSNVHAISH